MSSLPEPATGAISFQYLAEIAVGDTARVDLCRAVGGTRAGQLLAVKRLHPHVAEDPAFADMFLDEVWMTAALKHPNVVEVAGWGTDAQGAYLAVELVQGVSLVRLMKTVFETGEVFTERMVVFIASKLCAGLAAAHALRSPDGEHLMLVHRDLTPGNVLASFSGGVKIADFGLAKAKQRVTKTLTGLLKGKPQYMAPEQARGGVPIDGRADLFSLGVVLFELFSGRRPWSAASEMQMMHLTQNDPPIDLRECRPKIDKELVAIVTGLLEKDPAARFQSADEVSARLDEWLRVHGYMEGNEEALARFVRRNAMRQMRWFERAVAGELAPAPESVRPPRPEPPAVPAYTNGSDAAVAKGVPRPAGSDVKRARVKPRKPLESEADATDAEFKVPAARREIRSEPTVRDARIVEATPTGDGFDESELVPTLVQKASAQLADLRARGIGRAAARPPPSAVGPPILDEESDQRTTGIRRATEPPPERTTVEAQRPRAEISDMESGDAPTHPVSARAHAPLPHRAEAAAFAPIPSAAPPGQIAPPNPAVPQPPIGPRASTPPPSPYGAPTVDQTATSRITEDFITREADRLSAEAVRLSEESIAAATLAVHKANLAKIAGESASIAADAVRLVANGEVALAAQRLEEARSLEQRMHRGDPPAPAASLHRSSSFLPPPPAPLQAMNAQPQPAGAMDDASFIARLRPGFGGMRREVFLAFAGGALFVLALVTWLVVR